MAKTAAGAKWEACEMNVHQLRIVLEVVKAGSISKAAANLFMSQPNASSNIRALEKELGFDIFVRASSGITLTPQGVRFMEHVRRILSEVSRMEELGHGEPSYSLHVGMSSFSPMADPFVRLCAEYSALGRADLSCVNVACSVGLTAISNMELDIMVGLLSFDEAEGALRNAANRNLSATHVKRVPVIINVREGHPLIKKGELNLSGLSAYPYVEYSQFPDAFNVTSKAVESICGYRYRILVDERDTRCRIVGASDAFSIGCNLSEAHRRRYNIVSFPLPSFEANIYSFIRHDDRRRPEIRRYMELLGEELERL